MPGSIHLHVFRGPVDLRPYLSGAQTFQPVHCTCRRQSPRREAIEAMGELSTEKRCRAPAADDSVARRAMTAAAALLRLRDLEEHL